MASATAAAQQDMRNHTITVPAANKEGVYAEGTESRR